MVTATLSVEELSEEIKKLGKPVKYIGTKCIYFVACKFETGNDRNKH